MFLITDPSVANNNHTNREDIQPSGRDRDRHTLWSRQIREGVRGYPKYDMRIFVNIRSFQGGNRDALAILARLVVLVLHAALVAL